MSKNDDELNNIEGNEPESVDKSALADLSSEELVQRLQEAENKVAQYLDRSLRMQAEHENILRRTERDVANAYKYSLEKFALELLPIIDSLELCLSNVPKEGEGLVRPLAEGVDLTLKMFYTAMEKFGIKQINPLAQPFDPEHHQAIAMQSDTDADPGSVIAVLQKGYALNNRLLRPALVTVASSK